MFKITFHKKWTQYLMFSVCICMLSTFSLTAQVVVTSAGNVDMCVGGAYITIPDFKVAEKVNTDFGILTSLQTYELNAPSNFEFNPGVGIITTPSSTDISFAYLNVTATKITLSYFLNATAQKDSFIFKNIQVRAVGTNSANDLRLTGGNAYQKQNNNNIGQFVHAHFNSANANVSLNVSSNSVCSNGSDINLNGSPGGGTYSGSTGISGNTFKPAIAGPGSYIITYTATNNGCTSSATAAITVKTVPAVTFFGLASSYCSADDDAPLTGFPSGGTFSGSGIVNTSFFRPSNAGVGNNQSVTYQYTSNGCQGSVTMQTSVKQSPTVGISLNPNQNNYFSAQDSVVIGGTQSNPTSGGIITVSGNGVTSSGGIDLFHPNAVGQANNLVITRTLTAPNGCAASDTKTVSVSQSVGATINGLSAKYCKNSNDITMTVNNSQGIFYAYYLVGGFPTYSTPQIIIDNNTNDGIAQFSPKNAPYIGSYLIIFSGNNGSASTNVEITGTPSLSSINIDTAYCNSVPAFNIVATGSSGGAVTFSGTGVNNNTFNPGGITLANSNSVSTIITYSYTDINNCQVSGNFNVKIKKTPTNLSISGLDPLNKYCDSASSYSLKGSPSGGFFKSGVGMGTGVNDTIFYPQDAAKNNGSGVVTKNYVITYIYIDPINLCQASVDSVVHVSTLPDVGMTNINTKYCSSDPVVDIAANISPSIGGFLTIKSSDGSTIVNPGTIDNSLRLHPDVAIPGKYDISYKFTNAVTKCWNTVTKTTTINPLPIVTFTNLEESYCIYDKEILLDGAPYSGTGNNYTSLNGTASISSGKFQPSGSGVGKHVITYSYTDNNGCSAAVTRTTTVYGQPVSDLIKKTKPRFTMSSLCAKDSIKFKDLGSLLDTSRNTKSFIKTARWKFDNTIYQNDFNVDTIVQLSAGTHSINYTLTTDKGCFSSFDSIITIGSYPKTDFTWDKICNTEDTRFYNTSSIDVGLIKKVIWQFSDGKDNDTLDYSNNNGNAIHKFENPAKYKVILTTNTNYNCVATNTHNVFILQALTITKSHPYSNDFNDKVGDWVTSSGKDTIKSSWDLGIPNKTIIKSNNAAWVTGLKQSFNPTEISYVYSPCFTLDSITRPMVHMDIWSATNKNISGANLQYSIDGTTWNTLGKTNESGINWYNNETNISSRPSGALSLDQNGWTGKDSPDWKNARHIFDKELGTNKNIRFRISFAGGTDTTDGFAFDNVWIGDRKRLILAEHFTNNSSQYTKVENTTLNNLVSANLVNSQPKDIVSLQYHTAFPGPDPMNARNIDDPGARSLYYGITQIPYTSVDGSYFNGSALKVDTNMIHTRSLYDPAFDIVLNPIVTGTSITGDVQIINKIPVNNTVVVYVSLLERYVNNIKGKNGEDSYQWVHAKFLPNAGGTSFSPDWWSAQSTQKVNLNWTFPSDYFYDENKLAMIAFVQNNVTNEIYQAAYKGIGATVTTAVFEPNEKASTISLYPNPANDITTVVLNGKLKGNYNWLILDELGRVVDQGSLANDTEGFVINTANYANGFYTLRLSNAADGVKTQKFVVVH